MKSMRGNRKTIEMALLVEQKMLPIPDGVTVVENWGNTLVVNPVDHRGVEGDHMMVRGSVKALKDWLRPFDAVWVTQGTCPALEQFAVMHVGD
jgi:hypothetical protein